MTDVMTTNSRQGELGDFLRSRRDRLTPKAVGLPDGRRRRTPGLRREEVADLAGIGVDWYIRLEQGRSVSPSVATDRRAGPRAAALQGRAPASEGVDRKYRPAGLCPRDRSTGCPAHRRAAESAGLYHRPALGRAGMERGGRRNLRLQPDCRCRSQQSGDGADQAAHRGGCSARHGLTWRGAWSPSSGPPMTSGPAIPPFANCWSGCGPAARNLQAGGRRTMSAVSRPAINPSAIPKRGGSSWNMSSFQANDDPALKLVIYTPV